MYSGVPIITPAPVMPFPFEGGAGGQFEDGNLKGFCNDGMDVLGWGNELRAAISAELLGFGILRMTFRAFDRHGRFLLPMLSEAYQWSEKEST
jgi:hypothetical protein